ncbi:MAG TPA: hypothetical protein PLG88_08105 [Chitinophagaceae bacterium]|nr:hypothetical protein [Chitinophagaceae bacterium]
MKKKKIIILSIVILALSGGLYAYMEFNRKVKDLSRVRADVKFKSGELIQEFEKDEKAANALYLDKIISVQGQLKAIEKDLANNYSLVLGDAASMSSVRCSMDADHQEDIQHLKEGVYVSVKGACTGFNADELLGSDVILNRCVIQD